MPKPTKPPLIRGTSAILNARNGCPTTLTLTSSTPTALPKALWILRSNGPENLRNDPTPNSLGRSADAYQPSSISITTGTRADTAFTARRSSRAWRTAGSLPLQAGAPRQKQSAGSAASLQPAEPCRRNSSAADVPFSTFTCIAAYLKARHKVKSSNKPPNCTRRASPERYELDNSRFRSAILSMRHHGQCSQRSVHPLGRANYGSNSQNHSAITIASGSSA
jgi:hypothetical protein